MSLLPIFVKLDGRSGLLVGAGVVATEKIGTLLQAGLRLRVVAPLVHPEIEQLAAEGKCTLERRPFELADLDDTFIAITATNVPEVNHAVYRGAVERNIFCNSVDDIPNCDFYFGSVVRRGPLQIAISTAGESPALAQQLRRELDEQLPADLGPWLESLGRLRREVLSAYPRGEERRLLLHQLAQRQVCDAAACPTRRMAFPAHPDGQGRVWLVGAGPGDPDLLTVKAMRLIQTAEVVLHDDLVPAAILNLVAPSAEVVNVGKRCGTKSITQDEINALMVEHAQAGRRVVRLKSGDPLLFGRAAEEMAALREANVPCEVVPGITAAFAAAAALGSSLTDRKWASSVVFSTGHHAQSHNHAAVPALENVTRVVYMPGRDLKLLAEQWIFEGLPPELPCAVVSRAAQPDQQVFHTTLERLGEAAPTAAPSLLIAGWALQETEAEKLLPSAAADPATA